MSYPPFEKFSLLKHVPITQTNSTSKDMYANTGFDPGYLVDKEFADAMKRIQDEAAKAMTGQLDALYRKAILSLIHISEPTRPCGTSRMPSSA